MQTQLFNETHNFWACLALIDPAKLYLDWVRHNPHICCQSKQTYWPHKCLTPCLLAVYPYCHGSGAPGSCWAMIVDLAYMHAVSSLPTAIRPRRP